jgi:hypothetical protein
MVLEVATEITAAMVVMQPMEVEMEDMLHMVDMVPTRLMIKVDMTIHMASTVMVKNVVDMMHTVLKVVKTRMREDLETLVVILRISMKELLIFMSLEI